MKQVDLHDDISMDCVDAIEKLKRVNSYAFQGWQFDELPNHKDWWGVVEDSTVALINTITRIKQELDASVEKEKHGKTS